MAKKSTAYFGFNRGLVSRLALARVDMKRLSFSAETMQNWMPRVLGSMMLRPGLAYLGSTADDFKARFLPFVFSTDDTALIEITDALVRVWLDDEVITRPAVTTAVTNGEFTSNVNNWTDNDEAGATSSWHASGYLQLVGDGDTNAAIRRQTVTVTAANQNVEHALRVVVNRGPVAFAVGSTVGGDEYVSLTTLDTGIHSLAFTPAGNFTIEFSSTLARATLIDSVAVEAAGAMEIAAPWGENNLKFIRSDQSGDILFVACKGFLQRKIERRALRSWSVVWYLSDNGPYLNENTDNTTIASSALTGNVTLTASQGIFSSDHVGALFKVRSVGQAVSATITAQNTFSNTIEVTGVGEARRFAYTKTGSTATTVTVQRSIGVTGNWVDVTSFTANVALTLNDGLDNQSVFYRIGVKTGGYVASVTVALDYPLGSITGVARVTGYTSATSVTAEVLSAFGSTTGSKFWSEGSWSSLNGFPSAVAFYEGRLWWAGKNGIYGSVSDDFYNYNPDTVGDSGPINRTVGSGPVDDINWLLPLQRLIVGAEGAEHSVRATSFDEVLTPSNFNIKEASSQGSAGAIAVKIDSRGVFVQRGGTRLFELAFDANVGDYASVEDTLVVPDIGEPEIVHVAVQRLPDTRVHCVRSDGIVAVLIHNHVENVLCWVTVETDGVVEDVAVLPGDVEDNVYYVVNRTIDGVTKRYLERWALESEARGETMTKTSDSYVTYTGAAVTSLSGLDHLEGETVVVWGNGKDLGTKTVVGGLIDTISEAVTSAVVGLPYTADWKSTKLSFVLKDEAVQLTHHKRITQVGFVLADAYDQSLTFGPSFDTLDDMPLIENSEVVGSDVRTAYDEELIEFPGEWGNDARLCIRAASPRPVTILAAVLAYESEEKS
jgi:hypothetical protein